METDEPPVGFPSWNLLDSCPSGRMGNSGFRATNPDWNADTLSSSILVRHCQSNRCGPDLISLKCGERDYPDD